MVACRDCLLGDVKVGDPKGRVETLYGLPTYIAEPPTGSPKGIIVIIPDGFGWKHVNNRILADHYAEQGNFLVYLPNFMNGDGIPSWMGHTMHQLLDMNYSQWPLKPFHFFWAMYGFLPFMAKNNGEKRIPCVESFFTALRENEGKSLGVGVAGFCWGGFSTFKLGDGRQTKDGQPMVDACFTAHPSLVKVPDDVEKVRKPMAMGIGTKDMVMSIKEAKEVEKILAKNVTSEVVIYEGAGHGFSSRVDNTKNPIQGEQAAQCEKQAINWFTQIFNTL